MDDLEAIKGQIDVLIARSWAQEAMLLLLLHKEGSRTVFLDLDVARFVNSIRDQLRHSALTDSQIALVQQESKAMLERLGLIAEQANPDFLIW